METIKNVSIGVLLLSTLVLGGMYANEANNNLALSNELIAIKAVSESVLKQKQKQVDTTNKNANTFLQKAKEEYEKRLSSIKPRTIVKRVLVEAPNGSAGNAVYSFQEPATVVEPKQEPERHEAQLRACEEGYVELWDVWRGLCGIYGCED